jgi:hypothetical protein
VVPTTSRPRPRSSERSSQSPVKSISLKVTLPRGWPADLERLAQAGLTVEKRRSGLSVAFSTATPEEALEKLKLVAGLLAPKP